MQAKLTQVLQNWKEPAIRQSLLVSVGTGVNSVLGLLFYLLVLRHLSVGDFGEFSFLLAIGVLAAELADFGMNASILKFAHNENFSKMVTLAFYVRFFVGVLLILLALVAQLITNQLFIFSALVACSYFLANTVNQAQLAKEKFLSSVLINIAGNSLRLILIFLLSVLGLITITTALGSYIVAALLAFVLGLIITVTKLKFFWSSWKQVQGFFQTVFPFASWIGFSYGVTALAAKIDSPLVFTLLGPVQTGLYAGAQKIASSVSQFAGVLDSVFAPKLSKAGDKDHFKTFFVIALLITLGILISIPFVRLFVTLVFPPDYASSIPILEVLLIGYAIFFISTPFATTTVYKYGKSKLHLYSSVVQLVLTIALYFILLPKFGALGAAITFVLVNSVTLVYFIIAHTFLKTKAK